MTNGSTRDELGELYPGYFWPAVCYLDLGGLTLYLDGEGFGSGTP